MGRSAAPGSAQHQSCLTLSEFFGGKPGVYAGYAPAADNNPVSNYVSFVARRTGIDPNARLSAASGSAAAVAVAPVPVVSIDPAGVPAAGRYALDDVMAAARANAGAEFPWVWAGVGVGALALYLWMD